MSLIPFRWHIGRKTYEVGHSRSSPLSETTERSPTQFESAEEASRSKSATSAAARQSVPETALKVTDTAELERHLQISEMPPVRSPELFCPMHRARIYCHSVLVDKLGELTKFMVSSLHEGHTLEEVSNLTKMGEVTIQEEVDYLVRGGLLSANDTTLTSDGHQYGELLTAFNDLSDGIEVYFNEFANIFELGETEFVQTPNQGKVLKGGWIPALSRNENCGNSLAIARDAIGSDIPFSDEIEKSLYTTVRIDGETTGYKKMQIKDISKGTAIVSEPCVCIAVPFARISYKPKYSWVNPYRNDIEAIRCVSEEHAGDLLTGLARHLLVAIREEESADVLRIDIDEITGMVSRTDNPTSRLPEASAPITIEGNTLLHARLDPGECEGIFLEETEREELHRVVFFSYEDMEAC